jgi:lipoprotein-anchoring transpeptidase ErfK/SrfK
MKYDTKKRKKKINNKTRKQFLFNPENPDTSFDVYIDKNPMDTINIKYTTIEDVKNTIDKLEKL